MKKVLVVLLGVSFLASCNRDSNETLNQGVNIEPSQAGVIHYEKSQLEKDFTPMNSSTNLSGKSSEQLNYTFRGYANPVEYGGTDLAASAVFQVDDMIFVAWHTNDYGQLNANVGTIAGSLCAYRLSGIGQYELMDRVDFEQHDLYGVSAYRNTATGNIEVLITGQRDPATSGYVLNGHVGAVVARMDYDYINDEFWEGSLNELPLTGVAGTGIVALGANYFVTTGDGIGGGTAQGGLFQVDRSLRNVIALDNNITDAIDIEVNPGTVTPTGGDFYVLDRNNAGGMATNVFVKHYAFQNFGNVGSLVYNGIIAQNGDHRYIPATYVNDPINMVIPDAGTDIWVRDMDNDIAPANQSKGHLVVAQNKRFNNVFNGLNQDSLLIAYGTNGNGTGYVYKARGGQDVNGITVNGPSLIDRSFAKGKFSAITFDPALGVLYCGGGEDAPGDAGISVIAMGEFSGDLDPMGDPKPFVSTNDLVGKLALPTNVNTFDNNGGAITVNLGTKAVNDITVYQARHIAVSLGEDGLMFIQKNH